MQIKVWLPRMSPMVGGHHLYQFCLRAARYGSWELSASSPKVTLAALRLCKGTRFAYKYDLNIPRRHEVRVQDLLPAEPGKARPRCIGGNGVCRTLDGGHGVRLVSCGTELLP